jgi:hypothetical protein
MRSIKSINNVSGKLFLSRMYRQGGKIHLLFIIWSTQVTVFNSDIFKTITVKPCYKNFENSKKILLLKQEIS